MQTTFPGSNSRAKAGTTYTLYFADQSLDDPLQPMKRLRFDALPDAVDRALAMKQGAELKPLEIRDDQGHLITSELAGWRVSSVTAARPARPMRAAAG